MKKISNSSPSQSRSTEPLLINRPKAIAFFGMRRFFDDEHLNDD